MRDDAKKKELCFARAQLGAEFEFAEREKASAGGAGAGRFGLVLESREGRDGREMKMGELVRSAWLLCSRAYARETR
jgi:hypothetical protein